MLFSSMVQLRGVWVDLAALGNAVVEGYLHPLLSRLLAEFAVVVDETDSGCGCSSGAAVREVNRFLRLFERRSEQAECEINEHGDDCHYISSAAMMNPHGH